MRDHELHDFKGQGDTFVNAHANTACGNGLRDHHRDLCRPAAHLGYQTGMTAL